MPIIGMGLSRMNTEIRSTIKYIVSSLRLNMDIINCNFHIIIWKDDKDRSFDKELIELILKGILIMGDIKNIVRKLTEYNIRFEENVLLKNRTWIKTGGVASLFITPVSVDELVEIIDIFKKDNVGFEIVGHTSNLYYLDDYNPTAIVATNKIKSFREKANYIECECGVPTSTISRYCVEKGFTGYSGLVNLPGTVGAAICNNSSCFECSLSEHLIDATFYDLDKNEIIHLVPSDFNFAYRSSKIKTGKLNGVLLTLKLDKKQGVIKEEKAKAEEATICAFINKAYKEPKLEIEIRDGNRKFR